MPDIHPTAIVDPSAKIADDVVIGPYSVVEHDVEIGAGTRLLGQCRIGCYTKMGSGNIVYPFAAVGTEPEDCGYTGTVSYTEIGNDNRFRESCTINRGTHENTVTRIGSGCFLMANTHVAHNCQLGDRVIMVPYSGIAGYCEVGSNCLISGLSGMHQFCRMGRLAVLSGGSVISMDLPPFMVGDGRNGGLRSFNIVGLRRNGFSRESIAAIKEVYNIFFRHGLNTTNAIAKVEAEIPQLPEVVEFLDFVRASKRGILSGDHHGRRA